MLAFPTIVITSVVTALTEDIPFSAADFNDTDTGINMADVPEVVLPGALFPERLDDAVIPGAVPVSFTVVRNLDQFLPGRVNDGRYARWRAVGAAWSIVIVQCGVHMTEC